jgi:tagatose-6-phosphate ketose/aldose isomerase
MMLAAWLAFSQGAVGPRDLAQIADCARAVLQRHNGTLREFAARNHSRVVFLGSNALKAIAREAALKLLELTDGAVVAVHESALGFRHGPKTIVTPDTLLVMFVSNDAYARQYDLDLLRELRADARAGAVLAITAQATDSAAHGDWLYLEGLQHAADCALAFPYAICGQLYAFHRALQQGAKPDQPSVSGTVSRVVRGVTVHPFQA